MTEKAEKYLADILQAIELAEDFPTFISVIFVRNEKTIHHRRLQRCRKNYGILYDLTGDTRMRGVC